jgi:hypothetical protein
MNKNYETRRIAEIKAMETPETFGRFLLAAYKQAQDDIQAGKGIPHNEVERIMKEKLAKKKEEEAARFA